MPLKTPLFSIGGIEVGNDVLLAPMDGISDHPMRLLCRRMGSALSISEFMHVADILNSSRDLKKRLFFTAEERPFGFQLYGADVRQFLPAAQILMEYRPDFFDINLGCSVRRVAGRGAGAGMLNDSRAIVTIFESLRRELQVPITAKMRLGWDEGSCNHLEIAHLLQENGAAAISVHARTRSAGWSTPADWDAITEIKIAMRIPVIGNGDIRSFHDISRMRQQTGCDAVMVGRAALGNPWIFSRMDKNSLPKSEILRVAAVHWRALQAFFGIEKASFVFRKHLKAYLKCPQFEGIQLPQLLDGSTGMPDLLEQLIRP